MTSTFVRRASTDLGRFQVWLVIPFSAAVVLVGYMASQKPNLTMLLVLATLALVCAVVLPKPIMLVPYIAVFGYWRVGPGAVDMSLSDATLIVASLAALPFVPWRNRQLRLVLIALAGYLGVMAISFTRAPSVTAGGEIGHRGLLVAGSLFVGAALARLGLTRAALRTFVLTCMFMSVVTVLDSARHGMAAPYPFGMHKNAVGALFASGLLVMLANDRLLGFRRELAVGAPIVVLVGLVASQSRGAILAFTIVAGVHFLRHGGRRVRLLAPVVIGVGLLLLAVAVASFKEEQSVSVDEQKFTSLNTRVESYDYALNGVWRAHVLFGAGPKWFRIESSINPGPHNVVVAELSETGIAGLAALVGLLGAIFVALRRSRSPVAPAAALVLAERVLDSMLGIFWVAGTGTLPFLIVGLGLIDGSDDLTTRAGDRVGVSRHGSGSTLTDATPSHRAS